MNANVSGRIWKVQVPGMSDLQVISSDPHQGPETLMSLSRHILVENQQFCGRLFCDLSWH